MPFPPMNFGGPIEANIIHVAIYACRQFPPMNFGGPIEATSIRQRAPFLLVFPPMNFGGPIEAGNNGKPNDVWPQNFRR